MKNFLNLIDPVKDALFNLWLGESNPDMTKRVWFTGHFDKEKKQKVPPIYRWAIRFFLAELNAQHEFYYDSLLGAIFDAIADKWWYEDLKPTNEDIKIFEQLRFDSRHWLSHYRYYTVSTSLLKPKSSKNSFIRIRDILAHYTFNLFYPEEIELIPWTKNDAGV